MKEPLEQLSIYYHMGVSIELLLELIKQDKILASRLVKSTKSPDLKYLLGYLEQRIKEGEIQLVFSDCNNKGSDGKCLGHPKWITK